MIEMAEITELDMNKYIVVRREDIHKYLKGNSRYHTEDGFYSYLNVINIHRREEGKKDNRYVVLNLNDEIDIKYLKRKMQELIDNKMEQLKIGQEIKISKVADIAIALVNAIIRAKEDKQ